MIAEIVWKPGDKGAWIYLNKPPDWVGLIPNRLFEIFTFSLFLIIIIPLAIDESSKGFSIIKLISYFSPVRTLFGEIIVIISGDLWLLRIDSSFII